MEKEEQQKATAAKVEMRRRRQYFHSTLMRIHRKKGESTMRPILLLDNPRLNFFYANGSLVMNSYLMTKEFFKATDT